MRLCSCLTNLHHHLFFFQLMMPRWERGTCIHACPTSSIKPTHQPTHLSFLFSESIEDSLRMWILFLRMFFSCCHFQFYFLLGFFLFPSFFGERKLFLVCCRVLYSLLCIHLSCQNYLLVRITYNFLVENSALEKIKLKKIARIF